MRTTSIIGVGQSFAGDDAVGRIVSEQLRKAGIPADTVDDGAALLNLLMDAPSHALVIDAVVGGGAPGTLHELDPVDLASGPRPVSSHGVSVEQAVALARRFYPSLEIRLLGIAIEPPSVPSQGLTPSVAASVANAVEWVVRALDART